MSVYLFSFLFLVASVNCKDVRCGYCHLPALSLVESSPVCARSQCLPHVPQQTVGWDTWHTVCRLRTRGASGHLRVTDPWQMKRACAMRYGTRVHVLHGGTMIEWNIIWGQRGEIRARDHPWRPVKGLENEYKTEIKDPLRYCWGRQQRSDGFCEKKRNTLKSLREKNRRCFYEHQVCNFNKLFQNGRISA